MSEQVKKINKLEDLQTLVSLCKRRGFVFQSSEIYGGLNSCWDYGPLGAQLKRNVKEFWWKTMTRRTDIVGLDSSILMHPTVWEASGHLDGFSDPLVDCKDCKTRFREDDAIVDGVVTCPSCKSTNVTEARDFNLMFKTHMGPISDEGMTVYMRPETAQGIFVNFDNVQKSLRKKIPFGIAQIGKSFRNEITPGNFIFRTREFEQMEMQYFVRPGEDEQSFEDWKERRWQFYKDLGFAEGSIRYEEHGPNDLAHYAKAAYDVEYNFPFGWQELEGVHNRSDFDLTQHQKFSGKKMEYFDESVQKKYIPFVIETAVGCDRLTLALLCNAYTEEVLDKNGKEDTRIVLKLMPSLAPYQVAILPLSKKEPLMELSDKIYKSLSEDWNIDFDAAGSIGKRYRRQDEIGTPFCLTVDFESLDDQHVTIRNRDTMEQERLAIDQVCKYLKNNMSKL